MFLLTNQSQSFKIWAENKMASENKQVLKSCPFCGNEDLYCGHIDFGHMGIGCQCGARMIQPISDEWIEGTQNLSVEDALKTIAQDALNQAIEKWNNQKELGRLQACMKQAGLECFIRDGTPEQVSQHMRNVAASANAKIQLLEEKTWDSEA
jgi:hypothetical protein